MDKSWIEKPRNTNEYWLGLDKFLDFAFKNAAVEDTIRCPCPKCGFGKWHTREIVHDHLICKSFPQNYVIWNLHGEKQVVAPSGDRDVMQEMFHPENLIETMLNDAFGYDRHQAADGGISQPLDSNEISNEAHREDTGDFHDFLKDGSETLHEGSKYTKLEFLIKLYHIKVYCGLSDKAMTMILDLLRDAFEDAKLPPFFYEAKKTISKHGLDYTKIPACTNNCMLYWEGDSELEASLMWTISDFPGLGILFGGNTHTGFACPTCNFDTEPCRLRHSKKWCFMGHRRFLRRNHRFRLNRVRFNGSTEERNPPLKLSGSAILRQIEEGRGAELYCRGKRSRGATKQWNKRKQLLPLAIRNVLPDHVVAVLVDFCSFFRALSSKTLNVSELDKLQERIESTFFHLEILFPPTFFTVMVHLSIHLAEEAKLGGPVHHRNMYPVER
uniref:Uncharacterized protein LOC104237505 n=1 Tax=Nicotiana sylvestris TaxID=4096 RepID=A0A1U7XK28_NICSY|nr:PREDICTED: uncharacterized protein LOC104237505 [Nicotiana sylvestris]